MRPDLGRDWMFVSEQTKSALGRVFRPKRVYFIQFLKIRSFRTSLYVDLTIACRRHNRDARQSIGRCTGIFSWLWRRHSRLWERRALTCVCVCVCTRWKSIKLLLLHAATCVRTYVIRTAESHDRQNGLYVHNTLLDRWDSTRLLREVLQTSHVRPSENTRVLRPLFSYRSDRWYRERRFRLKCDDVCHVLLGKFTWGLNFGRPSRARNDFINCATTVRFTRSSVQTSTLRWVHANQTGWLLVL